jgi:hypothetical protein
MSAFYFFFFFFLKTIFLLRFFVANMAKTTTIICCTVVLGFAWGLKAFVHCCFYNSDTIPFSTCWTIYHKSKVFCHPSLPRYWMKIHGFLLGTLLFSTTLLVKRCLCDVYKPSAVTEWSYITSIAFESALQVWLAIVTLRADLDHRRVQFNNIMGCAKFILLCAKFQDVCSLALKGNVRRADNMQLRLVQDMYIDERFGSSERKFHDFCSQDYPFYLRTFYSAIQKLSFSFGVAWHSILYNLLSPHLPSDIIGVIRQYESDYEGYSATKTFLERVRACAFEFQTSEKHFIELLQKIDSMS